MSTVESFELLELLGTGGFAHTYRARVLRAEDIEYLGATEVALKIPLDKQKELRLKRELELNAVIYQRMRTLQSPNIVRYLGFGTFRNQIVMAMELVPGGNLRQLLGPPAQPTRLGVEKAVELATGVLNGLAAIHREHIFHRDIKPENILLAGDTPKIADLGIARILVSNEHASTTAGTIYYMSPEILSEEGASFPSDIWSVGVLLYEMLAGKLPFGDFSTPIGTMVDLIRRGTYVPPTQACRAITRDLSPAAATVLDRIIKGALSRDTTRRLSAEEMRDELKQLKEQHLSAPEKELVAIRHLFGSDIQISALRDAERRLHEIITAYPKHAGAYQCLGELYNLCQRYEEAIEVFLKGLKCDPKNALLHWDLSLAYQKTGRKRKAARHLHKVVELAEDQGLRNHAQLLLKTHEGRTL